MRDQPQPRQPHGVVDPHAAGVAQRGAQRGDERREAGGDQGARRKPGQRPVLAARVEQVGRRADRQLAEHVTLAPPGVAAGRVHADGKIADQPDTHAGLARAGLRRRHRAIGNPLQEQVEQHVFAARGGEGGDRGTARIAQVGGPQPPVRLLRGRRHLLRMQRLEHGVLAAAAGRHRRGMWRNQRPAGHRRRGQPRADRTSARNSRSLARPEAGQSISGALLQPGKILRQAPPRRSRRRHAPCRTPAPGRRAAD